MSEPAVEYDDVPPMPSHSPFSDLRTAVALILGGLVLLMWIGLIAASWAGVDEHAARLLSDVLMGTTVLAALAAVFCSVPAGIVALVAAAGFVAAWYYIGWMLSYAIPDVLYYGLIAGFYLAPPVVGICAILASRSRTDRLWR